MISLQLYLWIVLMKLIKSRSVTHNWVASSRKSGKCALPIQARYKRVVELNFVRHMLGENPHLEMFNLYDTLGVFLLALFCVLKNTQVACKCIKLYFTFRHPSFQQCAIMAFNKIP